MPSLATVERVTIQRMEHVGIVVDAAVATVRARGGEPVGEVENYQDISRLCYVRGPEGIIVEPAERIG